MFSTINLKHQYNFTIFRKQGQGQLFYRKHLKPTSVYQSAEPMQIMREREREKQTIQIHYTIYIHTKAKEFRYFFRWEGADPMSRGMPFHSLGPATEKTRSPLNFKRESVICRRSLSDDQNHRGLLLAQKFGQIRWGFII